MDALEERTGVSKRTISEIERGKRTPQTLTLVKLATGLGVDLDDLEEEESQKDIALPVDIDRIKEAAIRESKPESLRELQTAVEEKLEQRYSNEELFDLKDELEEIRRDMAVVKASRFNAYAKVVETENYVRRVLERTAGRVK